MPLLPPASAPSRLIASRRIDRHAISERAPESETALIPFPRHAPPRRKAPAVMSRLMAEIVALMASVGHGFPNLPIAILSWLIAEFFAGCAAYAEAMYPISPLVDDPVDRGDPVQPAAPPLLNRPSRARPSLTLVPATGAGTGHSLYGNRAMLVTPQAHRRSAFGADRLARPVSKQSDGSSASIRGAACALLSKLRMARAEQRALKELADVDDRTLRDIGLCRGEIEIAVRQEGYSG
jgi:uncharacterized protein YjiS (DUF1127 family)